MRNETTRVWQGSGELIGDVAHGMHIRLQTYVSTDLYYGPLFRDLWREDYDADAKGIDSDLASISIGECSLRRYTFIGY